MLFDWLVLLLDIFLVPPRLLFFELTLKSSLRCLLILLPWLSRGLFLACEWSPALFLSCCCLRVAALIIHWLLLAQIWLLSSILSLSGSRRRGLVEPDRSLIFVCLTTHCPSWTRLFFFARSNSSKRPPSFLLLLFLFENRLLLPDIWLLLLHIRLLLPHIWKLTRFLILLPARGKWNGVSCALSSGLGIVVLLFRILLDRVLLFRSLRETH